MYSNFLESIGLGLISWGIALVAGTAAGLMAAGISIIFIGATLDDSSVNLALRRGSGWIRYSWHRQMLREQGIRPPKIRATGLPVGWVPCQCGGDEECPVCDGTGVVPDPKQRTNPKSPHPPIQVEPDAAAYWANVAKAKSGRSRTRNGNYERIA